MPYPLPLGLLIAAFSAIFALIALDLAGDYGQGMRLGHVLIESLVMVISAAAALTLSVRYLRTRRHLREISSRLDAVDAESARWRSQYQELIDGLGSAIQEQFRHWQLSPAESEIALLLLKGLSHQEIAIMRGTGERTVREQARSAYRKAGLSGRTALSAFFLEDLLLPIHAEPDSGTD